MTRAKRQFSEEELNGLRTELKKVCSGIMTEKGRILINWFGEFVYMYPETGKRFISKGELKYGPVQVSEWAWAVETWKNADGTKSKAFELKDISMYQKCATLAQEVKRDFLFGMSAEEKAQAENSAGYKKILDAKNTNRVKFVNKAASNSLRDFVK